VTTRELAKAVRHVVDQHRAAAVDLSQATQAQVDKLGETKCEVEQLMELLPPPHGRTDYHPECVASRIEVLEVSKLALNAEVVSLATAVQTADTDIAAHQLLQNFHLEPAKLASQG
jgi:hypothetical protein